MKKKLLISIVVSLLLVTTVAMASSRLLLEPITSTDAVFEPNFDRLAAYIGYDTDEKFNKLHQTALFMGRYCADKESFSYIEEMILSGCDIETTMDIYQFYLTTNEDISIVRQIYDMVYHGEPIIHRDIVFENAFNEITNNKCGVLTKEDVDAYLEKGLTFSDISDANLLSRKGVMTIGEILDARLEGIGWDAIVEIVSGEKIASSYKSTDISTFTRAMSISAVTDEPLNTVLSGNKEEERFSKIEKTINAKLKSKGYWKGQKSENFDKIVKMATKKGITETKVTELLDKGYSENDLINMINHPDCTAKTIDAIAEIEVSE